MQLASDDFPVDGLKYRENFEIDDEERFSQREKEIKIIRSATSRKAFETIAFAYGLTNPFTTCYLNVFMQLLLLLPRNEESVDHEINQYLAILDDSDDYIRLYAFLSNLYNTLITTTDTINMRNFVNYFADLNNIDVNLIINQLKISGGGSVSTLIRDFLSSETTEMFQNGEKTKIAIINPLFTFQDNMQTINASSIKNILFCEREKYIGSRKYDFPLSFEYDEVKMGLKAVVTHPPWHFKCYLRIGVTDKFIEIDDEKIRVNVSYPLSYTNLALYIKIP